MTDRPIIFSGPMVRALLAGRKTQTRRLVTSPLRRCDAGDRLYVRESFTYMPGRDVEVPIFAAGYPQPEMDRYENVPPAKAMRWAPSIHMPRRHSRLTLVVEKVRVEPLQSISEPDAKAEGTDFSPADRHQASKWILGRCRECAHWDTNMLPNGGKRRSCAYYYGGPDPEPSYGDAGQGCSTSFRLSDAADETARFQFRHFWNHLHPLETWQDNPAVVALTFRVLRGNIDEVKA